MNWLSSEVVSIVIYLLPGFVTAWIFYGLTAHRKDSPFERVVQALIFTVIIQAAVVVLQWVFQVIGSIANVFGPSTEQADLVWSVMLAVIMGVVFSWCANNNFPHSWLCEWRLPRWTFLPKWQLTSRTSFPSEWFSALHREKRWIVLHLKDGRRLYGWPYEWPDHSDTGHFAMDQPMWLLDDGTTVRLPEVVKTLVAAADVEMVEFLKYNEEETIGIDQPPDRSIQSNEKEQKHGS